VVRKKLLTTKEHEGHDSFVTLNNYGNKRINSFKLRPPFSFPPRGKGLFTPSPVGEGWEGGINIKD
jgi:hypothetical protein